jgi:serine/threonine-protein kinase
MSPEQFTGSPCDGRSDVYSLGVVAYEALTGQLPFNARELAEWPLLHIREEPAPFDATPRGADVPLNMKRAVMRALAKRPQDRQQSMRELYNELTIGAVRRSSLLASPYEVMAYMPPEPPTQPKPTSAPPPPGVQQAPLPAAGAPAASGPHGTLYAHGPRRPGPTVIDGPPTGEREEVVPMTVREPVPMTMREPKRGRRWPIYIGFGLALASGAAIALVLGLGESPRPKPAPTVTTPLPATQPPPTTAPVPTTPPTATTAAPLPTAPPTTSTPTLPIPESLIPLAPSGPSACRQAIDAANAGFCSLSQRARQRCPEDNPDHQEAHRAWDAKCKK